MELLLPSIAALLLLAVAAYAQVRIGIFTRGARKAALTRLLLVLVGAAFGWTAAAYAGAGSRVLAFLIGFGVVHVPAALVLFLKGWRGEGCS